MVLSNALSRIQVESSNAHRQTESNITRRRSGCTYTNPSYAPKLSPVKPPMPSPRSQWTASRFSAKLPPADNPFTTVLAKLETSTP